ncbi:MAG: cell division protein ZapA [Flammeovirgaceae bacterium]|nr:cell division protein ZapA [Flammeovirgaceae bacterium]HCX23032.1 cell division protein ZapA [Cytophagales bacterium]|tara:strand:- start:414 stop:698 length:285 start_codon:yes stop_codon:yes gene_type:complete
MTELSIKLKLANREYPMKVKAEDEEGIRKAGKMLNEKIKAYRDQFGIDDNQDLLAMVAFDCLVEKMKKEETTDSKDEIALDQIRNISQLISSAI